jgi:tetratricopeptide (TPR) repeat protein
MKHKLIKKELTIDNLLQTHNAENHLESVVFSTHILSLYPELSLAWNIMGINIAIIGDHERSIQVFSKALHLDPYNFHFHNNIANVLKGADTPEGAERSYRRAIALNPQFHLAYFNLGELKLHTGEVGIQLLKKCLLLQDGFINAPWLLSEKLITEKRYEECAEWLKRSPRALMRSYDVQIRLISCLFEMKDHDECRQRSQWLISVDPAREDAYLSSALATEELGLSSRVPLHRALLITPESLSTKLIAARNDIDEGRFQSAKDKVERILKQDPNNAAALSLIPFSIKMKREDAGWVNAATRCASREDVSDSDRIALLFSMGKYYDDIKAYDRAFHFYDQANKTALTLEKDPRKEDVSQLYNAIIQSHEALDISTPVVGHSRSQVPVFIVGMPRSGSSLIEQILASHPKIAGAGELPFWQNTLKNINKAIDHPQRVPPSVAKEITEKYLSILSSFDAERVIDKSLINFVFLGYILALFPNAKIIHTHRDPIDTCLSIYFSNFGLEKHPSSYRLEDIRAWYIQYHKLMTHWISIIPADRMLNLAYQDVVNDPDFWTRKALSFVGLPYDPNCASFFNTERRVHTSSNWQVRQPIYNSSLNRWRNYEPHISTLLDLQNRCQFGSVIKSP